MTDSSNENYIQWKHWNADRFAQPGPGAVFYFDQFFNKNHVLSNSCEILEVGFGNGELLGYLRARDHDATGVELNSQLVERAKISNFVAYVGLIWEIPELEVTKYDLIVAFDVVEHMSYAELNLFFSWARNHLGRGGKLVLRFPEGASPFGLAYQNGDFTHVTALTKGKISSLCKTNDLVLLSYRDEFLRSDALCKYGLLGKAALIVLQGYARMLRLILGVILYPLSLDLRLSTNSIAVMAVPD